jgi:hypothetical protein
VAVGAARKTAVAVGVVGALLAGGVWIVAFNTIDPVVVWVALLVAISVAALTGPALGLYGRLSGRQILAITGIGVVMFLITMVAVGVAFAMTMGPIGPD